MNSEINDEAVTSEKNEESLVFGTITGTLYDENGNVKSKQTVHNKITDVGDIYQATRIAAGVNSNSVSQPTLVNGMKLGTGTTTEAKNGAGAALVAYITGSNSTFDAGFPTVASLGGGLGASVSYQVTWPAGTATNSTIWEVVIVLDSGTNGASTAPNTIARGVFGSVVNKLSTDVFVVTWNHKQLGA